MFWKNLWNDTDSKVLLDFIKLENYFSSDFLEFQRLGILHSAAKNDKVLLYLAKKLKLSQEGFGLIKIFVKDFSTIREFCRYAIESSQRFTNFKLIKCITARKSNEKEKSTLKSELQKILKSDLVVEHKTDEKIVGGSIIEIDHVRFDSSYAKYFKAIEKKYSIDRGSN